MLISTIITALALIGLLIFLGVRSISAYKHFLAEIKDLPDKMFEDAFVTNYEITLKQEDPTVLKTKLDAAFEHQHTFETAIENGLSEIFWCRQLEEIFLSGFIKSEKYPGQLEYVWRVFSTNKKYLSLTEVIFEKFRVKIVYEKQDFIISARRQVFVAQIAVLWLLAPITSGIVFYILHTQTKM